MNNRLYNKLLCQKIIDILSMNFQNLGFMQHLEDIANKHSSGSIYHWLKEVHSA